MTSFGWKMTKFGFNRIQGKIISSFKITEKVGQNDGAQEHSFDKLCARTKYVHKFIKKVLLGVIGGQNLFWSTFFQIYILLRLFKFDEKKIVASDDWKFRIFLNFLKMVPR